MYMTLWSQGLDWARRLPFQRFLGLSDLICRLGFIRAYLDQYEAFLAPTLLYLEDVGIWAEDRDVTAGLGSHCQDFVALLSFRCGRLIWFECQRIEA